MNIEVHADDEAVARAAAAIIASAARAAASRSRRFVLAVSGGRTPWLMLHALAGQDVPWNTLHVFQVDERVAPDGSPERNFTHLEASLLDRAPLPFKNMHAMPVELPDLDSAARQYSETLRTIAATPPELDLVHLGLGSDGHTASLVPGDPVLDVVNRDVAIAGPYQGRKRMTLTYPIINRTKQILWLVTGGEKAPMLARLREGDPTIPAGRVLQDRAIVLADAAAAGGAAKH